MRDVRIAVLHARIEAGSERRSGLRFELSTTRTPSVGEPVGNELVERGLQAVGECIRGIAEDQGEPAPLPCSRNACTSARTRRQRSPSPSASTLRRAGAGVVVHEGRARRRRARAPRCASAPVPANRSSTSAPGDPVAKDREHRLADAVGGRPNALAARRRCELPPLQLPGDDPHAAIDSVRSSPKRRRTASISGPSSGASSAPWRSSRAQHLPARRGQQLVVVGQHGRPEGGQARLPRAEDLALAAQQQVDLGQLEPVAVGGDRLHPLARASSDEASREEDALRLVLAAPHPCRAADGAGRGRSARRPRPASRSRSGRRSRPRSRSSPPARRRRPTANASIAGGLRRCRHLAVQQLDVEVGELAGAQALELLRGRLRLELLRALDERTHDERLAPLAQALADELVGARAGAPPPPPRSSPACARRAARSGWSSRGRRRR